MMCMHRAAVLSALVLLVGVRAIAGEPIATDRPDFVESSDVVGKGRFQIETGMALQRDRSGGTTARLRSTPSLLRAGIGDDLELRLETDGALRETVSDGTGSSRQRGRADLSFGAKWHQQDGDEASARPGVAWLLHVDGDTGSRAFRGRGWRPSLRVVAEWELAHGFGLGVMPGLVADRNEAGKRFLGGILAAVVGKSLTDSLRGFVEIAGRQLASKANGGRVLTLDTGLTYLLTDTLQLDIAVSRGIGKHSPDLETTLGLSVRF